MFNSTIFWFVLGFLLVLSEFLIPGFTIFFFGLGALLTSLILLIIPDLGNYPPVLIIIFVVSSVTLFITLRNKFKNSLKGENFSEREDYIGSICEVTEMITPETPGRIKYQGTTWTAISETDSFNVGEKVTIVGKKPKNPMIFIIKKI